MCLKAMSETMSSPSDHWGQFYDHSHQQSRIAPNNLNMFVSGADGGRLSDATVVSTTVTSTTVTTQTSYVSGISSPTGAGNLSSEGRVSRPVRRRSRASRRTPTTLLSTDTTNFKAMVQQFTGGPSASIGSGSHISTPKFSFALNPLQTQVGPGGVMLPAGFNLQYQQQQYQQPSRPPYMFSLDNNTSNSDHRNDANLFFQGLGNPRPGGRMEVSDGLVMDGVSSQAVAAAPPQPPSSSPSENRSETFLF